MHTNVVPGVHSNMSQYFSPRTFVVHMFVHAIGSEFFELYRNVFDASVAFLSRNLNQGVSDIIH